MFVKMLINGQPAEASDGAVMESYNPYSGELLGTCPVATKEDVDRTLAASAAGQKVWAAMSYEQRAEIMLKAVRILELHESDMSALQCREMGKPIGMCRDEWQEVLRLIRGFVAAGKHQYGKTFPNVSAQGGLGDVAFTVTEPLGVAVCIGPFNFPLTTPTFKAAAALILGNSVIIKAPSDCPLTVLRYVHLLNEAGFPAGVVQAVSGRGSVMGDWLTDNDIVRVVGFTGSTQVGSHLMELASKHFVRTLMELGGNDALIITEDASIEKAAGESLCRTANAGQICCISKRFLVHNSIKQQYIEKLVENLKGVRLGDPLDPETQMSCMVSERAAKTVEEQIAHTVAQGARLVYGGERKGAMMQPTVLDCTKDMDIAKDMEVFGPVWAVIGFDSDDEAIEIANSSVYGLNGGVIAGTLERGITLASRMHCGTVVANGEGSFRRDTHCFGGYKHSGVGREGIMDLMEEFSQRKTIVIRGV